MNHHAIMKSLANFEDIILSTTNCEQWQPFDIQLSIERSSAYHNNIKIHRPPKRHRYPTSQWGNLKHRQPESPQTPYNNNDTNNDTNNHSNNNISYILDKSTTSTITTSSDITQSTHNAYANSGYPVSTKSNNDTFQANMPLLQQSITTLTKKVDENRITHQLEIEQLELRCNTSIKHSDHETKHR
jgi:hypothetical protein